MKTPTLDQLKKRPALWFHVESHEPCIIMPNGQAWFYDFSGWVLSHPDDNWLWDDKTNLEFGGWL